MNTNRILSIMIALAVLLVVSSTVANMIPWYRQNEPMKIGNKELQPFKPGEHMRIDIERTALIGIEGRVTRELVRVHRNGDEEEVYKLNKLISIERGTKRISVYYKLPSIRECPQMKPNTYVWRGSMVYKPFGYLEKTYQFSTEKFQINTAKQE